MARPRRRPRVLLVAERMVLTLALCAGVALVGLAFAQRIEQNIALRHDLTLTRRDVRALRTRRAEETREVRRLQHPQGAVPYIYRRLRMVRPGQTLIYLVPTPSPGP